MTSDSTVVSLRQPDAFEDPLTAILRSGARRLLAQAIEAEAASFLATMQGVRLPDELCGNLGDGVLGCQHARIGELLKRIRAGERPALQDLVDQGHRQTQRRTTPVQSGA